MKDTKDMALSSFISTNKLFFGAGCLSVYKDPRTVFDAMRPVNNLRHFQKTKAKGFQQRLTLSRHIAQKFAGTKAGAVTESHQAACAKATTLIHSPLTKAFSSTEEPTPLRQAYKQNKFEQAGLMARHLAAHRAKFSEVASYVSPSPGYALGSDDSKTNKTPFRRPNGWVDKEGVVREVLCKSR